jgi:TonB family protein
VLAVSLSVCGNVIWNGARTVPGALLRHGVSPRRISPFFFPGFMRVLVVDQDLALLTAITQSLREYFALDAVSNKADCLDLLRVNEFDVIVAGERLEDGSGLELLGQLVRRRPNMLRIFAAERERLKLLKGRLGPFGLFRTLSYPIEPHQLLAVLTAAGALQDEVEDSANTQRPGAPTPARKVHAGETQRASASAITTRTQVPAPKPAGPRPRASQDAQRPERAPVATGSRLRPSGHPRTDSLSQASQMAIAARAKQPQRLEDSGTRRSAFLVGAGVAVVLGLMGMAFKLLYASDAPPAATTTATAPPSPTPAILSGNAREDSNGGARAGSYRAMPMPAARSSASSSVIHDARLIKHVAPEYPPTAASRGIEGVVELRFTVTKDGTVTHATIVRAEPAHVFNHSAIAAVRRWKYEPKTINGVPVEAHMQLPLQFKMNPHEP